MEIENQISRRSFLALCGSTALIPSLAWTAGVDVPPLLDHFILGCDDLDRGIAFVEKHTGVRAAFGGVHPGRGTRNALLALGERKYLEIMAIDRAQNITPQIPRLLELKEPRIVGWAVHPADVMQFAAHLREAGVAFKDPQPGSRQRLDGKVLHWKSLTLTDDRDGLLPFFIEWSADSLHPSADAPKGCRLERFAAVTPNPQELAKRAAILEIDLPISSGQKPALEATIVGPQGQLTAVS
jgi:catechol 2,3-dioxygenase-like lactoylglutathione lyase family enzyme